MESRVKSNDNVSAILSPGTREHIRGKGVVEAVLYGSDGAVKGRQVSHNTVTTLGLNSLINQCASSTQVTQARIGWMAVGSASAGGTTNLVSAVVGRHALDSLTNTASANAVLLAVCTFASGDSTCSAIYEAGLFSASGEGVVAATTPMYAYTNFATPINKAAEDSLVITWAITLS